MEENREEVKEEVEAPKAEPAKVEHKAENQVVLKTSTINALMGVVALFVLVFCRILDRFNVGSSTFFGIMAIIVYCLPLAGLCWAYLRTRKPSFEFWLNVVVFGLAVGVLGF